MPISKQRRCFRLLVGSFMLAFMALPVAAQDLQCSDPEKAWLEIVYTGEQLIGNLPQQIRDATLKSGLEVIRIINNRVMQQSLHQANVHETLDDLVPEEVFKRCLDRHHIPLKQRPHLTYLFKEALQHIYDDDQKAE